MREITNIEKAAFIVELLMRADLTELEKMKELLEKVETTELKKMAEALVLIILERTG